ncbi:MAG: PAS domain-containing protein [Verrucomicrobia bacterium]|nr:PAS domain-containing protein [Verrucomicrobiota bacterium]
MKSPLRVLYLEDDPRDAELVQETLAADGIESEIVRVETESEFVLALKQGGFELVLADYTLPSFDGLSALEIVQKDWPELPLIFVSGTLGEELAIEALKKGATDYVFKTRLSRIVPSVQRALREAGERSDLIRAQEALLQSEAYLAEAQRISHIGSFGWDVASGRIYWSQETYRIFDLDPASEPALEFVLDRTHPDDRAMVQQLIDRVSNEKTDFDFEHRLLLPNGSVRYVRVAGRPAKAKSGNLEFMGLVSDITERKLGEEALQKAQAELAHVTRVSTLGELTASIAHEINQPLAAIVGNANAGLRWLSKESPDLDETRDAIRRIIRDGNRAGDVISRMRALFKKAPMTRERFDLNDAIEDVVALTQGEAQRNRVLVRTRLGGDVPLILGDRVQLQQVVLNLLINAIEAMSAMNKGRRELLVSTEKMTDTKAAASASNSYMAESAYVLVAVRDSGPGLHSDSLNQLFTAFYTTKPKGLGMGLAVSRSIIEAHEGRLEAISNDGPGATFQFTLPVLRR